MQIPFKPVVSGIPINVHLILEYLAFFLAFRYYLFLRKRSSDTIPTGNRLSIILGATIGALVGSRLMGFLENPFIDFSWQNIIIIWNLKTIMGGLFGGLLGVESAKKLIGEKQRSGDLFTLPIILGIFIGRIGCFLSGTDEFTYGTQTSFFTGMDLGDGIMRHPIALYELIFLLVLFIILRSALKKQKRENGMIFQWFMISYFAFRFLIEFIKPNVFFILGLSSIQWLCIICLIYYIKTIAKPLKYAYKKIHLL
ncbi:prolipoprotein diacylglyceryl transferase [Fulvivirga ligni]|uniref:prolipoprotein diacylglyceryl transferase n=1 Tax=Fulvivirga ligni TaxID=2904246 RepID=UPI001F23CAAD|nr:prolipoprotein diacylglyceryl transferase family protein [Fulvivirga ligni]UII22300.1 prolipoprotein diacylglyceryl transferase [Fulvivirga ligni]